MKLEEKKMEADLQNKVRVYKISRLIYRMKSEEKKWRLTFRTKSEYKKYRGLLKG
jgi:uncharacterized protein YktA (UPF0223 family)